ncbi:lysozyme inhibitor LprI family protein [Lederbergia ruris]|uniref:Lysozyme inhibitor LprI-like N-terminal domain-containing protein n=1 Tax=Lederbergia ruris TaxID=217495 RepID=A0ABQ4KLH3_9BACI|nr:lysozyme inhibitor LprI family protein [Lederbergia ruris]GIN58319.1 hypothetical protein J8TS2_26380 [Lederbergia ruris]
MKSNRKILMTMSLILVILLAACGSSSNESNAALEDQSEENQSSQDTMDNSADEDSIDNNANTDNTDTDDNNANEKVDPSNNEPTKEEDLSANTTANLKEEYLQKLNDAKNEVEEMRKNPIDDTTIAMKKVEGDAYDIWDGLLNEIYKALEKQLPAEEMEQLRKEQREWIDNRDHTAKEASLKYEGGTMEQLEYVKVENDLTEERCFELVENYMK